MSRIHPKIKRKLEKMTELEAIHQPFEDKQTEINQLTDQLDESIVDRLSKRNTGQGISDNTKRIYLSAIRDYNQFLAKKGLHVSSESLRLYFDSIKRRLKASTLNLRRSALLKCVKTQMGENNILRHMAIEKTFQQVASYKVDKSVPYDECLTEFQVRDMIQAAQSEKTKLIIQFLYKTACRVGEMIGVRLSDCKPVNGYIKIRMVGKGKKERDVSIPSRLYDAILSEYQGRTWLFESKTGHPLNPNNVGHQVRKAARRIGMTSYSPHMLRHARATDLLLKKGQSLKAVSLYLGHSSVAITAQMYIHDEVNISELFSRDMI